MEDTNVLNVDWLPALLQQVRNELASLTENEQEVRPAREEEIRRLESQAKGWSQSLAKVDLSAQVRSTIEAEWSAALTRCEELRSQLDEESSRAQSVEQSVQPQEVLARLERLSDVLAAGNPTMGNLELSLHIDRIICYHDGHVTLHSCKLGILPDLVPLLSVPATVLCADSETGSETRQVTPRRRGRLRTEEPDNRRAASRALADFAADPNRFANLDECWFWTDTFQAEKRKSWSLRHAAEVAARRGAGLTEASLAAEFGKSIPTIRAALRYAALDDDSLRQLPRKMPRSRWHEDHAQEVALLQATTGLNVLQLATHFGKSDTTIRKALRHYAVALAAGVSDSPGPMRSAG